jgi:branched-chain amino acid transport system permease protein
MAATATMEERHLDWAITIKLGVLGGLIAIYLCLVGMVTTFADRDIVQNGFTFAQAMLALTAAGIGYVTARRVVPGDSGRDRPLYALLGSAITGLSIGLILGLLAVFAEGTDYAVREMFINISPELVEVLTFGQGVPEGILLLAIFNLIFGLLGGFVFLLPSWARNGLFVALSMVVVVGLLRDILRVVVTGQKFLVPVSNFTFASEGLTRAGAIVLFVLSFGLTALWSLRGRDAKLAVAGLPAQRQTALRWVGILVGILLLLILPQIMRSYLTNVTDKVGLFIMMGLGLNIVVGFAGLLDLGYVAFYAIGAYSMAVLTTTGNLGGAELSFWAALPIAIGTSVLAGIILGVPVLNMRGDYLAIVTLGFGEIIRLLALSNWLAPFIGGAQGIIPVPRPAIRFELWRIYLNLEFDSFQKLYYLILIGCAVAFFVSWRLRDSRLGRSWMALREDEDVAEAMGINLVSVKLFAFATGAAFAGAAGAIFASQVSSIFPHSFDLLVSITVLSVIIVGGIGSLPGVIVGSFFLVGLPEILTELQEFRLLFYGAALVLVMLVRPEGLWPEPTHRRELHDTEVEDEPADHADPAAI